MKKATVLIQESDPDIRFVLKLALEAEQFTVFAIPLPEDIMNEIQNVKPNVVTMDYILTGEPCREACSQVKLRYPDLPVIVFSCNSDIRNIYRKYGFDDYIEKPFSIDRLYGVISRYIR